MRNCWLMPLLFGMQTLFGLQTTEAATWTVNTVGDAGDGVCDQTCTFRDAVQALQADDRILFALTLPNPLEIQIIGPTMAINVPARITGTDGVPTMLRRTAGTDRFLTLQSGADVRIVGIGFQDGVAPVPLTGGSAQGGAILVDAGAALECRECVFRGNRALAATAVGSAIPGTPGPSASGGAIHAEGDVIIDGGVFVNNEAVGAAGVSGMPVFVPGGAGGGALGGAIAALAAADILNSTFFNNLATGGTGGSGGSSPVPPGLPGGNGGNAQGGALYFGLPSTGTVAFSTFSSNVVVAGAGGPGGVVGGADGVPGQSLGAAMHADASAVLNSSVVLAHAVAACAGTPASARTSNLVTESSCPGQVLATLDQGFDAIGLADPSPALVPRLGSPAVDSSPDCLDALGLEAVVLDQRLNERPMRGGGPMLACDYGAIEYTEVMLRDGFEDPPPPP